MAAHPHTKDGDAGEQLDEPPRTRIAPREPGPLHPGALQIAHRGQETLRPPAGNQRSPRGDPEPPLAVPRAEARQTADVTARVRGEDDAERRDVALRESSALQHRVDQGPADPPIAVLK